MNYEYHIEEDNKIREISMDILGEEEVWGSSYYTPTLLEIVKKLICLLKNDKDICNTCKSCGNIECCGPSRCKFGLKYIENLNQKILKLEKENLATRKTLEMYIKKSGWATNEDIINQEIKFYGED
jgi:hypothetical protein